jgi:hypothetical protein
MASLEVLQRTAAEERGRAYRLVEELDTASLDKAQRALRRKILHQLTGGLTLEDSIQSGSTRVAAIYDSTRRALWLLDQLYRTDVAPQQSAAIANATAALHVAEDAAGEATRLA